MSAAAAVETAVPVKSGKKKLVLIIVVALVLLMAAGGGAALFLLKKQAHAEDEADADADGPAQTQQPGNRRRDPSVVPVFVPLESFTVNLADREADRFAQIGISLELNDAKAAERIKQFMPAIRNNILMVLAHKRSSDLLERSGKELLANEVLLETERALGVEPAASGAVQNGTKPPRPVRAVHFFNFIIQ